MSIAVETEREFKFDVDADFDPPDLRPVVGRTERLPEVEHRSAYFDTADFRLWARGITLRHRMKTSPEGGGPGEWTLKLPLSPDVGPPAAAGPGAPSERSEVTWTGPAEPMPAPVGRIVAGVVRRAPLVAVAELHATRRRLLIGDGVGGQPWAEIDDDLVEITSGPRAGHRFRQIEVELAAGRDAPDGQLEAVIDLMRAAGAAPGGGSKLGSALGLDGVPGGDRFRPRRSSPMAEVVRQVLSADVGVLLDCDVRLRQAVEEGMDPDVELIHRARVAARRLRSHLGTLDPVLDPVWVGHVRGDLRTVGRALGRVRDADVLRERIRAHADPADRQGVESLVHLVAADRRLAAGELASVMTTVTYLDMVERICAAAASPPLSSPVHDDPAGLPAGPTMRDLVAHRWRRVVTDIAGLADRPDEPAPHQVRIRVKRLRYAAEAAEPYLGRPAGRVAATAKKLQDALGERHDATTAVAWLREMAEHPSASPQASFVAGRIAGRAEEAALGGAAGWRRAARRLNRKKVRSSFR